MKNCQGLKIQILTWVDTDSLTLFDQSNILKLPKKIIEWRMDNG
jgi:hypothetical protein